MRGERGKYASSVWDQKEHLVIARAAHSAAAAARWENDPQQIGTRTLLAMTCKKCGRLQPGTAFRLSGQSKGRTRMGRWDRRTWYGPCATCRSRRNDELVRRDEDRLAKSHKTFNQRMKRANDAMPQPRKGYQWTGPELEVIERRDLTARQAGVLIGRSKYAVEEMRKRIKVEPKLQRVLGAQT